VGISTTLNGGDAQGTRVEVCNTYVARGGRSHVEAGSSPTVEVDRVIVHWRSVKALPAAKDIDYMSYIPDSYLSHISGSVEGFALLLGGVCVIGV
jgi:hypothetical protein